MATRKKKKRPWRRRLRHATHYVLVWPLYGFFGVLPLDAASALGGWIGRHVGVRLAVSRKARENIARAFPDLESTAREAILKGMWENLGRVMAEYPHLQEIVRTRVTLENPEQIRIHSTPSRPVIFISGHLGNWEIGTLALARHGVPLTGIYRAPNNPLTGALLARARAIGEDVTILPKSPAAMRALIHDLRQGRHAGFLIDQKYSRGLAIPFFGHPALTSTAFADLALRYDLTVLPVRGERTGGAHFRLTIAQPLPLHDSSGNPLPVENILQNANTLLESWIREKPAEWLWIHRRWKDNRRKTPP